MSSIILSEKFEKELVKFIAWLPTTDYKIRDIVDNDELEWKDSILTNFEEPGRNKLESYIREMSKIYFITKGDQEVNDVKFMANDFRTAKVKNIKKEQKQKNTKKEQKQKNNKQEQTFKISVGDFDTSDTFNLDTLDCYTADLINLFGQPLFFKDETEFQYEWRLVVDTRVFSIYNWKNDMGSFDSLDDCEWYLGGTEENTKEQFFLKNYIKQGKIQESEVQQSELQELEVQQSELHELEVQQSELHELEVQQSELHELEVQQSELQELEVQQSELQELDDKIDIELDFIDDENLEINIDDIDFDF
jgi:hypothetical protein